MGANSFLLGLTSFQKRLGVQKSKQEVTKVVSLVKILESLPSVSSLLKLNMVMSVFTFLIYLLPHGQSILVIKNKIFYSLIVLCNGLFKNISAIPMKCHNHEPWPCRGTERGRDEEQTMKKQMPRIKPPKHSQRRTTTEERSIILSS